MKTHCSSLPLVKKGPAAAIAPALRNGHSRETDGAPRGLFPREAMDDPHRLALGFLEESCQHAHGFTLRFWRNEWHRWDGSAWRVLHDLELRAELTKSIREEMVRQNVQAQEFAFNNNLPPTVRRVTSGLVTDVVNALASLTLLPFRFHAPAWLDGKGPWPVEEVLSCRNGLVHLPSVVDGTDYFLPPTPRFFSPNSLNFDFDFQAPPPSAWLAFLKQLWPEDSQSIETLQEWMGYFLTPDTRQQKILLVVGPRRSGKGTIARVIRALVGPENVACPTLSSLGTNFGLWPLLDKTVAMIQDARLSARTDIAGVVERLLPISGEDAQTIDRKNLSPVTAKLNCRFMLSANELPHLPDVSGALPGRMILLRLSRTWFGQEDTHLTDRLLKELPGILQWSIVGWQRLRDRGYFVQPDSGKVMVDELTHLASPIGAFVQDCCRIGPAYQVEKTVLYRRWQKWCAQQGRNCLGDAPTFGRYLRAVVPTIGENYPRTETGRVYFYTGIGLL